METQNNARTVIVSGMSEVVAMQPLTETEVLVGLEVDSILEQVDATFAAEVDALEAASIQPEVESHSTVGRKDAGISDSWGGHKPD